MITGIKAGMTKIKYSLICSYSLQSVRKIYQVANNQISIVQMHPV